MRAVKRLRNRRGQSVVEYLVVAAAVIAVILGIRGAFSSQLTDIAEDSVDKVERSANRWNAVAPEGM